MESKSRQDYARPKSDESSFSPVDTTGKCTNIKYGIWGWQLKLEETEIGQTGDGCN
jgi:hypothetical protein